MNAVQRRMKAIGLTQQALGDMLDPPVPQAQISMWVNGVLRIPLTRAFEIEDKLQTRLPARLWLEVNRG